jgi:hypothetical protein
MTCIVKRKKAIGKIQNQISHSNQVMQPVKQTERDTMPLDRDEAWVEVKGTTHTLKHFSAFNHFNFLILCDLCNLTALMTINVLNRLIYYVLSHRH